MGALEKRIEDAESSLSEVVRRIEQEKDEIKVKRLKVRRKELERQRDKLYEELEIILEGDG